MEDWPNPRHYWLVQHEYLALSLLVQKGEDSDLQVTGDPCLKPCPDEGQLPAVQTLLPGIILLHLFWWWERTWRQKQENHRQIIQMPFPTIQPYSFTPTAVLAVFHIVLVSVRLCYRPLPALECLVCYACRVVAKTLHQLFDLITLLNKWGIYNQRVVPGWQLPLVWTQVRLPVSVRRTE